MMSLLKKISAVLLTWVISSSCSMLGSMMGGSAPALPPSNSPTFNPNAGQPNTNPGVPGTGGIPLADPMSLTKTSSYVSEEGYKRVGYMAVSSSPSEAKADSNALYGIYVNH